MKIYCNSIINCIFVESRHQKTGEKAQKTKQNKLSINQLLKGITK